MTTVHPYFVAKARAVFVAAGGDPDRSGPLAAWAQDAHATLDPKSWSGSRNMRRRVLVAEDGTLLGEARHGSAAAYVTHLVDDRDADQVGREAGLVLAQLARRHGQPVIMVTYSDVCVGQAPRERV